MIRGPDQCIFDLPKIALAIYVEHPDRHDLGCRRHQSNNSGDVCAVAVGRVDTQNADLAWVTVVVNKVVSRHQPAGERGMVKIDTRIENRNYDRPRCPGRLRDRARRYLVRLSEPDDVGKPLFRVALRASADRPRTADCP